MIRTFVFVLLLFVVFQSTCFAQSTLERPEGLVTDVNTALLQIAVAQADHKVVLSFNKRRMPSSSLAALSSTQRTLPVSTCDSVCKSRLFKLSQQQLKSQGKNRRQSDQNPSLEIAGSIVRNLLLSACNSVCKSRLSEVTQRLTGLKNLQRRGYIDITFSDKSPSLKIANNIISSIGVDYAKWQLKLQFTDGRTAMMVLRNSTLGLKSSDIILNPNGITPLSAQAHFSTPTKGSIRVVIPGKGANGVSIEKTFHNNDTFEFPILGLYAGYTNPIEFYFYDVAGNQLSKDIVNITTQPLNSPIDVTIVSNHLSANDNNVFMEVGSKQAFDQNGEVRWTLESSNFGQVFDRLDNGNWLISDNNNVVVYHWPTFHEIDMLGNIVATYNVPNLGHHEIRAISNGSILVGTNSTKMEPSGFFDTGTLQEDALIEISSTTGQVVKTYDFNMLLDNKRMPVISENVDDWFHLNSADYDESDNSVVVSGRVQGVVKVDRTSGDLVWILAPHQEWPQDLQQYLLTPVDSAGHPLNIENINFWPYGQHSARVLPNGNILIYDNGTNRRIYEPNGVQPENLYTRAVEYKIDVDTMTIEKVWEFDYGRNIYTFATGEIDYLPESNTRLISYLWKSDSILSTPRVIELDSNNNIVFEYTINGAGGYRSDKFDLYTQ